MFGGFRNYLGIVLHSFVLLFRLVVVLPELDFVGFSGIRIFGAFWDACWIHIQILTFLFVLQRPQQDNFLLECSGVSLGVLGWQVVFNTCLRLRLGCCFLASFGRSVGFMVGILAASLLRRVLFLFRRCLGLLQAILGKQLLEVDRVHIHLSFEGLGNAKACVSCGISSN